MMGTSEKTLKIIGIIEYDSKFFMIKNSITKAIVIRAIGLYFGSILSMSSILIGAMLIHEGKVLFSYLVYPIFMILALSIITMFLSLLPHNKGLFFNFMLGVLFGPFIGGIYIHLFKTSINPILFS